MMYLYKRRSNFIIGYDGRSFNVFFFYLADIQFFSNIVTHFDIFEC